jgi:Galactose oxidase, central domain
MTAPQFTHRSGRTGRPWWGFLVGLAAAMAAVAGPIASPSAAGDNPVTPLAWSTISPPTAPPALKYASAVYDSDNKTIVLFGGERRDGTLSDDTWVWNGSTWTDYPATAIQAPPARRLAAMAFDPGLHQLILFGGEGPDGELLGDTWAWNGASWYQQAGNPSPGARASAAMAYAGGDQLVLFGGLGLTSAGGRTSLGDTWLWTSDGWTSASSLGEPGPAARAGAALAFDQTDGEAVLFGGQSAAGAGGRLFNDTWIWTGQTWSRRTSRPSPAARQQAVMVGDDLTSGVVLFAGSGSGGALGDTWLWNGRAWSKAPAGPATAAARTGAAAAFDAASQQLVVFGGKAVRNQVLDDTVAFGQAPLDLGTTAPPGSSPATASSSTSASSSSSHSASIRPPAAGPASTSTGAVPTTTLAKGSSLGATGSVLHRGNLVTLRGEGFRARTKVTITFQSASTVVGEVETDAAGRFEATVAVPENAGGGDHRFEASGLDPGGSMRQQFTAVTVIGVASASPWRQRAVLTGMALLIPVGTWVGLSAWGRWRRRSPATR